MHLARRKIWGHVGPAGAVIAAAGAGTVMKNGYRRISAPQHPLAMSGGYVLEHRFVLYNSIGPGTHHCYWCDASVTWRPPGVGKRCKGGLVVDHVDSNKLNNDITNLVPACQPCNTARSNARRKHLRLSRQG